MVSGCLWCDWSLPPGDKRHAATENFILRRYALFVAALGLAFCMKQGATHREVELRILTGELFNIGNIEVGADWYQKHEVLPLQRQLTKNSMTNPHLAKINASSDIRQLL